jgi:DNA-binding IclR family transcriptional regulator
LLRDRVRDHQLVARDTLQRYRLGLGITGLAGGGRSDLQMVALPRLDALVAEPGTTTFLVVQEEVRR